MAKLKAEEQEAKLGEGCLHGQLVKKLSSQQVESYSRWLNMHSKTPSVANLSDWLKKEGNIKMETAEMAHGLEQKALGDPQFKRGNGSRPRAFFTEVDMKSNQQRPPCQFCGQDSHPICIGRSMRRWRWTNGENLPKKRHYVSVVSRKTITEKIVH